MHNILEWPKQIFIALCVVLFMAVIWMVVLFIIVLEKCR